MDIVCNNGAVKFSRNLLDPSTSNVTIGEYYIASGSVATAQNNWRTGLIPIIGGKTYAFWGRAKADNAISAYNRINWFDANGNNISPRPNYTANTVTVGTAPSNAAFIGLSCACYNSSAAITRETFDAFNWMLAEASAEVPYQPYVEGGIYIDGTPEVLTVSASGAEPQTASVVNLFSVGNYADEQEIISGVVTHKVGIKVLDGTEKGWALSDSGSTHRFRGIKPSDCHTPASRAPSVCTHFKYVSAGSPVGGMFIGASQYWYFIPTDQTMDTVDKWTAWVAAQYAAGTPVIVLYPLATEITEQTEPHALHTVEGDNIVSWTYPGSTKTVEYAYQEPTNKVGTAKVGTAKAG